MKSRKTITDSLFSVLFLVVLGVFMFYTKGIVQKANKNSNKEIILAIDDSLNKSFSGVEMSFSHKGKIISFK